MCSCAITHELAIILWKGHYIVDVHCEGSANNLHGTVDLSLQISEEIALYIELHTVHAYCSLKSIHNDGDHYACALVFMMHPHPAPSKICYL